MRRICNWARCCAGRPAAFGCIANSGQNTHGMSSARASWPPSGTSPPAPASPRAAAPPPTSASVGPVNPLPSALSWGSEGARDLGNGGACAHWRAHGRRGGRARCCGGPPPGGGASDVLGGAPGGPRCVPGRRRRRVGPQWACPVARRRRYPLWAGECGCRRALKRAGVLLAVSGIGELRPSAGLGRCLGLGLYVGIAVSAPGASTHEARSARRHSQRRFCATRRAAALLLPAFRSFLLSSAGAPLSRPRLVTDLVMLWGSGVRPRPKAVGCRRQDGVRAS